MAYIHSNNLNHSPKQTERIISRDLIILLVISVLGGVFLLFISSQPNNLLLSIMRLFWGIVIIGLLPGFLITMALFPKQRMINFFERIGISLALNITILALIGYGLNFTIWGLTDAAIIITISMINIALCIVLFFQRKKNKAQSYILALKGLTWSMPIDDRRKKILLIFLPGAILIIGISMLFAVVSPTSQEPYTEFFIMEHQELGSITPTYSVGEYLEATLFIVNHEDKEAIFHIIYVDPDHEYSRIASILLSSQEQYEQEIAIELLNPGINQEVQFFLYREGEGEPYRSLQVWITVISTPNQ